MSQTWFLSESHQMMIVVFETRHLNHIEVYTHAFFEFLILIFMILWSRPQILGHCKQILSFKKKDYRTCSVVNDFDGQVYYFFGIQKSYNFSQYF